MKNKALILGMTLLMTASPAFAAQKIDTNSSTEIIESESMEISDKLTKKKVEEIKKLFNITGKYDEFFISKESYGYNEAPEFIKKAVKDKFINQYRWSDDELGGIEVSYTSDGNFVSYTKWTNNEEGKKDKKISIVEAQKKVNEFLPKLIKDFDKKYKLDDYSVDKHDGNYKFTYRRYINDIPSYDDVLSIEYSPSDEEFKRINTLFNYGYYPLFLDESNYKKDNKVDLETAKKTMLKEFPLELSYKVENGKVEKVYYSEILNIDAKTGNVIKNRNENFASNENAKAADLAAGTNLTEVELKKINSLKDIKSKEEAKEIAKELIGDYEISDINIFSDKDNYYYRMSLENEKLSGSITLNAKTLKLVDLSSYTDTKAEKSNLKESDVIAFAKNIVEKYSDKNEINFDKAKFSENDNFYEVFFPRYVNNIPVINDGITVTIDGNKKINNFSRNISKADFSKAKDNSITKEKANEIYLNSKDFGLKYQMTENGPKLYYGSINGIVPLISGDGILRNAYGNIVNFKEQLNYPDLDKAKDKDKILKLKDMNIGLIGRNLADKITYNDFFTLLGLEDSSDRFFTRKYNINIDEIRDKNITEKEIIKILVTENELERFTKAEGIFKEDVFENQKSLGDYEKYYIIAKGFGFIGEGINPNAEMKLEDALYLIYNSVK